MRGGTRYVCREERVSVARMYPPARVVRSAVVRMKLRRRLVVGEEVVVVVDAAREVARVRDIDRREGLRSWDCERMWNCL